MRVTDCEYVEMEINIVEGYSSLIVGLEIMTKAV